jgi:hypothetical protein
MRDSIVPRAERATSSDEFETAILDAEIPSVQPKQSVPISVRDAGFLEAKTTLEHG